MTHRTVACISLIGAIALPSAGPSWSTALTLTASAVAASSAWAGDAATPASDDPLHHLPELPRMRPQPIAGPTLPAGQGVESTPGVRLVAGQRVVMDGTLLFDSGPTDGMEVLACLKDGKTHESLVRLATGNAQLVKFSFITALGLRDGVPPVESSGIPARGTPVRVLVQWQDEDGAWRQIDASCLVRDRVVDRAYPPLPYLYTGSHFQRSQETGPDGRPVQRERFMLENTKSVAVNFDEPDALFASPFPGASADVRFEANSAIAPHAGTAVQVVFEKAELPLTLVMDATGALRMQDDAAPLDDAGLAGALQRTYGEGAKLMLRAVAVIVAAGTERGYDVAARLRILAAAAEAKAWVAPVFVLVQNP